MSAASTVVRVTAYAQSHVLPLSVNGRTLEVPVGVDASIPTDFLPALEDSSAAFTIVGEVAATAEAPAPQPDPEPTPEQVEAARLAAEQQQAAADKAAHLTDIVAILDGSANDVIAALDGKDVDELGALLAAESKAKKRKTVIEALKQRLG